MSAPQQLLTLRNRQRTRRLDLRLLRQILRHHLAEVCAHDYDITIHLVNATEMARVNFDLLQHTGSTDVITLDYSESNLLAGELFICVDEAILQARQFKTTWPEELIRYFVHGVLHLQGYDDLQPVPRRRMKLEEARRVRKLARDFRLSKLPRKPKLSA